jgi:hypothetical protein
MSILDKIKRPLRRVYDWAYKLIKRASLSVKHVEGIKADSEWFLGIIEELEPEARAKIQDILWHIEQLEEIWGFK